MTALVCLASSETFVLSFQYPNLKYLIMPKFSHGLGKSHSLTPSLPPPRQLIPGRLELCILLI